MSEEEDDEIVPVVIDLGGSLTKVGFSMDDRPSSIFPTIVGRAKAKGLIGTDAKDFFVGSEVMEKRGILNLVRPLQSGLVENWDDMELVLEHCFSELQIDPEYHPVLITDNPRGPTIHRDMLTKLLFEKFQVPAMHISYQPVLSMYASGGMTGCVLHSGDAGTFSVPIYEGYLLDHALGYSRKLGKELNVSLTQMLMDRGYSFTTAAELEMVSDIKEKYGYVSLDYDEELTRSSSIPSNSNVYTLPDGNTLELLSEPFRCTELLFQPTYLSPELAEEKSFPELCFDSIRRCDVDLRRDMLKNIVLSGGNTLFPGLHERMHKELSRLTTSTSSVSSLVQINIKNNPHITNNTQNNNPSSPSSSTSSSFSSNSTRRKRDDYSSWIGGSILSSLSTFQQQWITKEEYDENGVNIVRRKCY